IAHRLVSLMGGWMNAESEPGCGSTFWFVIPLLLPVERKPGGGERILIVEDNPINQIVALRAVNSLGYVAEVASGGEQAITALEAGEFAAILMDCQMPGKDGYQVSREIRTRE